MKKSICCFLRVVGKKRKKKRKRTKTSVAAILIRGNPHLKFSNGSTGSTGHSTRIPPDQNISFFLLHFNTRTPSELCLFLCFILRGAVRDLRSVSGDRIFLSSSTQAIPKRKFLQYPGFLQVLIYTNSIDSYFKEHVNKEIGVSQC